MRKKGNRLGVSSTSKNWPNHHPAQLLFLMSGSKHAACPRKEFALGTFVIRLLSYFLISCSHDDCMMDDFAKRAVGSGNVRQPAD
jgi:hypothetical protein